MKSIKQLSDHIKDELCDAEEYVREAILARENDPQTAQLYYDLSVEEMNHMDRLHTRVTAIIKAYRESNGNPPADMQARYDVLHEMYMEKAMHIKQLQKETAAGTPVTDTRFWGLLSDPTTVDILDIAEDVSGGASDALEGFFPDAKTLVLASSTASSKKKFKITVIDNGTISATEITG